MPDAVDQIRHVAGDQPDRVVRACNQRPLAALWVHPPMQVVVQGLPEHAIALHLAGSPLVEKWIDGRPAGFRSRVGSVSLVPAVRRSEWVLQGLSVVAHLYVPPAALAAAAEDGIDAERNPELGDFFAVDDAPLAQLVRAAFELAPSGTLDSLAHDTLMVRAARLLLRRETRGAPLAAVQRPCRLTASTLRRLFEHIDARLDGDLRLEELARVARLSADHFLRAFREAVGQTPHQYVLGRRLAHAQQLLRSTSMPMASVARAAGFSGPSHFAAAFRRHLGLTPSAWRRLL